MKSGETALGVVSPSRIGKGFSSGFARNVHYALGHIVSRAQSTPEGFSVEQYVLDYTSPYQSVLAKYSWVGWDLEMVERNVFGLDRNLDQWVVHSE